MRWLAKYPITQDEVLKTLGEIPDPDTVGGTTGLIKKGILDFFQDSTHMNELLAQFHKSYGYTENGTQASNN